MLGLLTRSMGRPAPWEWLSVTSGPSYPRADGLGQQPPLIPLTGHAKRAIRSVPVITALDAARGCVPPVV
jgi:hypothetical protein